MVMTDDQYKTFKSYGSDDAIKRDLGPPALARFIEERTRRNLHNIGIGENLTQEQRELASHQHVSTGGRRRRKGTKKRKKNKKSRKTKRRKSRRRRR